MLLNGGPKGWIEATGEPARDVCTAVHTSWMEESMCSLDSDLYIFLSMNPRICYSVNEPGCDFFHQRSKVFPFATRQVALRLLPLCCSFPNLLKCYLLKRRTKRCRSFVSVNAPISWVSYQMSAWVTCLFS